MVLTDRGHQLMKNNYLDDFVDSNLQDSQFYKPKTVCVSMSEAVIFRRQFKIDRPGFIS